MLRMAVGFVVLATAVQAQEFAPSDLRKNAQSLYETVEMTDGFLEYRWEQQERNTDAQTVVNTLQYSGYPVDLKADWLQGVDGYSLYSSTTGPGQVGYLILPNGSDAAPVTFMPLPFATNANLIAAGYSADEIRERIVEGTRQSIASICKIGVQPQTITGKASAGGIVEIEATWLGSAICDAVK